MSKILIVEDDDAIRGNVAEILEDEASEIFEAENGAIGLQLAREHLPDLIICDIMMPKLDGYGVLAALRQDPSTSTIPCIFLTAKSDKNDLRQGMGLGAEDYLSKPFRNADLLAAVKTQLQKREVLNKHAERKLENLRNSINQSLSHELITPLNGILGLTEILIEDCSIMEPQEVREFLEDIYNSGKRLHRLIENYLLYAQVELVANNPEKRIELQSDRTTLAKSSIKQTALQKSKYFNREADLVVDLKIENASIRIAGEYLHKIIEELVDNACKFSQPGTPIQVNGELADDGFILTICDRGRGMTVEQIGSIGAYMQFERRFYEQQGAGLGLAIVQKLVELHGGSLKIESIPSEQTVVRVSLPT